MTMWPRYDHFYFDFSLKAIKESNTKDIRKISLLECGKAFLYLTATFLEFSDLASLQRYLFTPYQKTLILAYKAMI